MNNRSAEETKKNIVEAGQAVFTEHGYAKASMRTIARVAGTSVGAIYLYFRNKEELYLTLLQERMKQLNDLTGEALSTIDDPQEAIGVFISLGIDFARKHQGMIIIQGRELGFSFGIDLKREFLRERCRVIADIIRKGMKTGVFRECDADEAAKIIFNMLRGFVVSIAIDEEALFAPEAYVDLMLHGLLRRNSG
ncbi:MAG: TetR/AcrR family transcriptional regulator [Geobacteraceae bacterium]